jgi:exodeoxyribonuclease VII large subunit
MQAEKLEQPEILSVSQLTRKIKGLLETQVASVWLSGEISNWRVSPAGHAYFTLKDKDSQIDAVMFRGKLMRLKFGPEGGLDVVVYGQISVYEKRGNYQIICEEMQPKGMGALQLAFEKLKQKLEAEGLFAPDHKKPLPLLPRRIGIVTSPTGAAIRDMLHVLDRRFANVHVLIYPARVQGAEAGEEIVEGIRVLDGYGVDVIIIGRGGGSLEDLWAFNEEIVVRAVYAAETPIISAVGHEIDFALTDFAADVRAPTPSAAAEIVVKEHQQLVDRVAQARDRIRKSLVQALERLKHRLVVCHNSYVFRRATELTRQKRQQHDELRMRLDGAMQQCVQQRRTRLERASRAVGLLSPANQVRQALERFAALRRRLAQSGAATADRLRGRLRPVVAQLDALSPLAILSRGYALAWKQPENILIRDAAQVAAGDELTVQFGRGAARATVTGTEEGTHGPVKL